MKFQRVKAIASRHPDLVRCQPKLKIFEPAVLRILRSVFGHFTPQQSTQQERKRIQQAMTGDSDNSPIADSEEVSREQDDEPWKSRLPFISDPKYAWVPPWIRSL